MGRAILAAMFALCIETPVAVYARSYTLFETGPMRPLALSPDGTRLFAVNIPDGRLEIFGVGAGGLTHQHSVRVGLEPDAVACRSDTEVWVINHLSDSVSIVDVGVNPPRVVRTLLVGDEPRDIVFAGPERSRAFITTAHRGQNRPGDPQLTTPGIGRADVWVFDASNVGTSFAGEPLTIITLFGDTPRGLATTPDGSRVYAAIFHSGNQTTALNEHAVCDGSENAQCSIDGIPMPGGLPEPRANVEGVPGPEVGLIVKHNPTSGAWEDELGRDWSAAVRFDLPDHDVFTIDAVADPPIEIDSFAHVGTTLFNVAVNPVSGRVYVSNTEARNDRRFAGPGVLAGHTVRGHLHEARITVIDPTSGAVEPHHLNSHIDYDVVPSAAGTKEQSLATPLEMALTSDGTTLYVAAFGSGVVGVIDTSALEAGTLQPDVADHITVSGGGPGGLVLDEPRARLYVLTRFDNAVSVIDLDEQREVAHLPLYNPEPAEVTEGRPFLYDSTLTSSNGEATCSACHVFGDVDDLGWDLGDPDGKVQPFGNHFHPMKGPMTVQTLRGIATHGPMHWRGDRNGQASGGDSKDERLAFGQFNEAFENLLGRAERLSDAEMKAYTDFVLQILPPPNPIRPLNDQLTARQSNGAFLFQNGPGIGCSCHVLMPDQGFFGTAGDITTALETQQFKVPQLRNMYARVGMFGMAGGGMFGVGSTAHMGDQIRGFGYLHDGSVDTLFRFLGVSLFSLSEEQRSDVEDYLFAFDADLAPAVGQQVTLTDASDSGALARIDLLTANDDAVNCDLTVTGVVNGIARGWVRDATNSYRSDRAAEPLLDRVALQALASAETPLTFSCVPPGSGVRMGVDRDEDGAFDGDEIDGCSDAKDPLSTPQIGCIGDCNRDCHVGIDELVLGVSVTLGQKPIDRCAAMDADSDGKVVVSELVGGVRHALSGCVPP
jgi:DNA-binding beta-propeller fold protein YncE